MEKIIVKYCKRHFNTDHVYSSGQYRCKKCRVLYTNNKRKKIKINLVKCHGGKCNICGYDKCVEALQFHHIDPQQKDYNVSKDGGIKAFNKVLNETKKCILVCANCHSEIHSGYIKHNLKSSFIENYFAEKEKIIKRCKKCNCQINKFRTYCSNCYDSKMPRISRRKAIRPSLIELEKMVSEIGYCAVGRKYGVTDNTIRKWIKFYKNQ